MDSQCSLQDVIRCSICETPVPSEHCENCHIHLCETCVEEHVSDDIKDHYIIPFEIRGVLRICKIHSTETCKRFCKTCNVPICKQCVSSSEHSWHKKEDVVQFYKRKKEDIKNDLEDLEKSIYPKFIEAASKIQVQRTHVTKCHQKLHTDMTKDGETAVMCTQFATSRTKLVITIITNILQKMQIFTEARNDRYLAVINKQEDAINQSITEIKRIILNLKRLQDSSNVCAVLEYNSKNEEFRSLYNKFKVGQLCYRAVRKSGVYK